MSDDFKELKDEEKEKLDAANQVHQEHPPSESSSSRGNNSWIPGVTIIAVGVIFLLSNLTDFHLNNWWALFILIPGLFSFANAFSAHKEDGRWSKRARGSLIGGLATTLVAVIFLFNWDWGKVWPLFLILGGIAALLGGLFDS